MSPTSAGSQHNKMAFVAITGAVRRVLRVLFVLTLAVFTGLLAHVEVGRRLEPEKTLLTARDESVQQVFTRERTFSIPFQIKGTPSSQTATLFMSRDGGVRWQAVANIAAQAGSFPFTVDQEGDYAFAVRGQSTDQSDGTVKPESPQLFVTVDETAPQVTARLDQDPSGTWKLTWSARDSALVDSSLQFDVCLTGQDSWQKLPSREGRISESQGLIRGVSELSLPVSSKQIRVSVHDRAQNVGAIELAVHQPDVDAGGIVNPIRKVAYPPEELSFVSGAQLPTGPEDLPLPSPVPEDYEAEPQLENFQDVPSSVQAPPTYESNFDEEVLIRAARNSLAMEELDTARQQYERLLQLNPSNNVARREYAGLLFRMGHRGVVEQYELLLANGLGTPEVIKDFAGVLMALGHARRAVDMLLGVVNNDPDDAEALGKLILAELASGRYNSARQRFDENHEDLSGGAWDDAMLAEILLQLGRASGALPIAKSLYASDPADVESTILLIRILTKLQQFDEALKVALSASNLSLEKDRWLNLAKAVALEGNYKVASFVYQTVLEHDPDFLDAAVGQSEMLRNRGMIGQAKASLNAVKVSRENPVLAAAWAEIHLAKGEFADALSLTKSLSLLNTDDVPKNRKRLGDIYVETTAYGLAESEYFQAGSEKATIQTAASRMYQRAGQFEQAVSMARQAVAVQPFGQDNWLQFVEASIVNANQEDAQTTVSEALGADGYPTEFGKFLHTLMGLIYASRNQPVLATQEFELGYLDQSEYLPYAPINYAYYRSLMTIGRLQDAQDFLVKAVQNPLIGLRIARLANRDGDCATAKQIVFNISESDSANILALQVYAEILARENDADCELVCRQILLESPTNITAKLTLAHYLWSCQRFKEANVLFMDVLHDIPNHRSAHRSRARMMREWRGKVAAIEAYEEALAMIPHSPLLGNLSVLQCQTQFNNLITTEAVSLKLEQQAVALADWRPASAAAVFETLHRIRPVDEYVTIQMAEQSLRLNRRHDAIATYEEHLAMEPTNAGIQSALDREVIKFHPHGRGNVETFQQSGRQGLAQIEMLRFGAEAIFPLIDGDDFFSVGYAHQIYFPGSKNAVRGNILELDMRRELSDGFFFLGQMDVGSYETGFSTRPVFESGFEYQLLDGLDIGVTTFLRNVAENTESIRQDLFRYGFQPTIDWKITPCWNVTGNYQLQNYSDDNIVHAFAVNNGFELKPPPRQLLMSSGYNFLSYAEESIRGPNLDELTGTIHPYFAPNAFSYVTLELEWRHWLSEFRAGEDQLYYGIDYGVEWDSLNVFYNTFGGTFYWEVNPCVVFSVQSDFIRSGAYDAAAVMVALDITFP